MLRPRQCALLHTPQGLFVVQTLQALFNYSPTGPDKLAESAILKTTVAVGHVASQGKVL